MVESCPLTAVEYCVAQANGFTVYALWLTLSNVYFLYDYDKTSCSLQTVNTMNKQALFSDSMYTVALLALCH